MPNIFKNFLNSLHLNDEDDEDEDGYDEYVAQSTAREQRKAERRETPRYSRSYYQEEETEDAPAEKPTNSYMNDIRKERTQKVEKQPATKVVPIRNGALGAMGIKVMKPTSFEDSQDICDVLLSGKATIINLEGFDVELAQRVMDFISGAVYAANGKLHQISSYIFIISPENIDISGDYQDIIKQNGFEIPTINRDF